MLDTKFISVFHGGNDPFTEIDPFWMSHADAWRLCGPGIYFTPSLSEAQRYGDYVVEAHIDPSRFLETTTPVNEVFTSQTLSKFLKLLYIRRKAFTSKFIDPFLKDDLTTKYGGYDIFEDDDLPEKVAAYAAHSILKKSKENGLEIGLFLNSVFDVITNGRQKQNVKIADVWCEVFPEYDGLRCQLEDPRFELPPYYAVLNVDISIDSGD